MNLNPKNHPNAYAGGFAGFLAAFVLHELQVRAGLTLDAQEQSMVSVAIAALVLFAGRWLSGLKPEPQQ